MKPLPSAGPPTRSSNKLGSGDITVSGTLTLQEEENLLLAPGGRGDGEPAVGICQ